ncbi:SxtJ family membrane protein [Dyadobacter aurulentus]|uniref:SxtJ family membrane protein n=1 Tax=Dyadobacter sp. UC 10 TaxID=2605428 RepID=UPI0011F3D80F|nr:SxtJ family membrane protein [Dyadobacter sp. UC 10]KAA0991567.1 hypothetical protein FXO21_16020 [Dyadobacter sp. UC 10]
MVKTEEAKSQLVIVTGLLVLHLIFEKAQPWFLIIAVTVGVISIVIPVAGSLLVKGWLRFAEILGAVNGRILLTLIFFLVLLPVAIIARWNRKDPLMLQNEDSGSVYTDRNHSYEAKDLDNVW